MRFIERLILIVLQLMVILKISHSTHLIDSTSRRTQTRIFDLDYANNSFLKDGKPFRFVGGSFHYFRALPETWQEKLRAIRAAGLNVVTTYVEWSLHNPKDGVYKWDGIADLERFIKLAEEENLLVILRPGPYICAERDLGGFPYWILNKYPSIQLRTNDADYKREVELWYSKLLSKMSPLLYGNGGPIIMVSVENEYGSFRACDSNYTSWLRDLTESYVLGMAVLFTNDGPSMLRCGHIDGVLPTLDFGAGDNIQTNWNMLRKYLPKGPLVNMEYYPGWLTHWQEPIQRVNATPVVASLREMLQQGANVNFYMFYGGTNFGFTAGANDNGAGGYVADITSYDYDAPLDEAGDPTTKYFAIRQAISEFLPLPNINVPIPKQKRFYGTVYLSPVTSLLSHEGRSHLSDGEIFSLLPISFEQANQHSGFLLYETSIPKLKKDPTILKIDDIRDRAYVYIDRNFIGVLSRESVVHTLPIIPGSGVKLQILVENQGRINYNLPNDFKGILSNVTLNSRPLRGWNITKFPLEDYGKIERLLSTQHMHAGFTQGLSSKAILRTGPAVFHGELHIEDDKLYDTYLDTSGWGKGIAFINGFNLGRYWPVVGPQITLYVPRQILRPGRNQIVFIEYQKSPESGEVVFTNAPNLNGIQRRL